MPGAARGDPGPARQLERIGDVVRDGPPRQEARLLEHESDLLARRGDGRAVQLDAPRNRGQEAGDDPEQRALARAVRPDERHDLAGLDGQAHPIERAQRAIRPRELGHDVVDREAAAARAIAIG